MTTTIERLPKRLFAALLGVVLALGLVPGLGAGVALAVDDTYTLRINGEISANNYVPGTEVTCEFDYSNLQRAAEVETASASLTKQENLSITLGDLTLDKGNKKGTLKFTVASISAVPNQGAIDIELKTASNESAGHVTRTVECTKPVKSVELDKTSTMLNKGETLKLTATVSPKDATDPRLNWTSSDNSVATVDSLGNVKAEADGEAIITATSMDGSEKSATCTVTVYNPVESITLDKKTATLNVDEELQLKATVLPEGASENVDWTSSDESVATVDSLGKVTAVAEGKATITVKSMADDTKIATCTVTVTKKSEPEPTPAPTYYAIEGDDSTWTRGSGKDLTFTFERDADDDTTFKHFKGIKVDGADVKADNYTASEGSVVITLKASYLEKLKVGKHTITAVFDDGTADAKFTVAKAAASSKSTSPKTGDMLPVALIAGLAILAVIVLVASRVLSRKQEPTDKHTN